MTMKMLIRLVVTLTIAAACAAPSAAQTSNDEIKKEIDSLREILKSMQKDLQEIKTSMAARAALQPSAVGQTVDFGNALVRGEAKAKLTLVEVSDYQCPFCGRYAKDTYPQVEAEYIKTGKVRSVFLNLPLESIHKSAFGAAKAAKCAGEQGKYWEMHDRLFANQPKLEPWSAHAEAIGIDAARFDACMATDKHDAAIRRDMAEASRLGITGTPGFLIGRTESTGTKKMKIVSFLKGARPFADFKAEFDRLLAESDRQAEKPVAAPDAAKK